MVALNLTASLQATEPPQTTEILSFGRTFGGAGADEGNYVEQTSDGGYVATGLISSKGEGVWDTWLVKVDDRGAEQWSGTYGISEGRYEGGEVVQQTADGGYIIVGSVLSEAPTDYNVRLIRTTANGRQIWSRLYGGNGWDWGRFVRETPDGGFIVTGSVDSLATGSSDLWLFKTDAYGEMQWSRTFGGIENDHANCVQPTPDGGYILTGATTSYSIGADDLWIIKTDAVGATQWMLTFGGYSFDEGFFVEPISDGNYIVLGTTSSRGAGRSDAWLIKLTAGGSMVWSQTLGGPEWDWGSTVHETHDGGFIITGTTFSSGAGSSDVWLLKTDSRGQQLWSRTFGGNGLDFGLAGQPTTDGGYIIVGRTYSYGAGNSDLWLIKTDSQGHATF